MTGRTHQIAMRAGERKTRLNSVIETPRRPSRGVVAKLTLRPKRPSMHIISRVAGLAVRWRLVEGRRGMACLAFNYPVGADQWKRDEIVIETNVRSPRCLAMA